MGETNCATVDTLLRANKLARQALKWAAEPMCIHVHRNPVAVGWSDGGWTTRKDGTSQLGYLVGIGDIELLQGKESPVTIVSWHSSKTPRVAKSSSAVELQGIGEVDDEMTYVRLALYETLIGPIEIRRWPEYARRIPAAVVTDCRGVYDALSRSASSCLGLKDKKSGLEALAVKQSLINLKTALRWCHSFAQLADCMTKDDSKSRESFELFQKRKFRWKLVSDPSFTAATKRVKLGLDTLDYVPQEESDHEMTVPEVPRALKLPQYSCKERSL